MTDRFKTAIIGGLMFAVIGAFLFCAGRDTPQKPGVDLLVACGAVFLAFGFGIIVGAAIMDF